MFEITLWILGMAPMCCLLEEGVEHHEVTRGAQAIATIFWPIYVVVGVFWLFVSWNKPV